ncbi:hypothetical protein RM553_09230 [Zunongwangia sp. F363]|uniref:Uncharacterized protein n=1 Tax=Autumnicola tepida TaxID=3075595 RepID=A0ABU3C9J3_9FLAO|nr:hypothetical protein [Zunongwangia sp. F363]MDT0643007.1 hypothetical protein [Zunongwangia sp. F363]
MPDSQNPNNPNRKAPDNPNVSPPVSEKKTQANKKNKKSLREHQNPIIRAFAKTGYTIWIAVMVLGGILAFIVSLVAV